MHSFFTTQHKYLKHLVNQHRPKTHDNAFSTGPGQIYQFENQPMPGLVTEQNPQVGAEESFYNSQLESGRLAEANNTVEHACDYVNRHVFNEAAQREQNAIDEYEAEQQMHAQQQQHQQIIPGPGVVPGLGGY